MKTNLFLYNSMEKTIEVNSKDSDSHSPPPATSMYGSTFSQLTPMIYVKRPLLDKNIPMSFASGKGDINIVNNKLKGVTLLLFCSKWLLYLAWPMLHFLFLVRQSQWNPNKKMKHHSLSYRHNTIICTRKQTTLHITIRTCYVAGYWEISESSKPKRQFRKEWMWMLVLSHSVGCGEEAGGWWGWWQ